MRELPTGAGLLATARKVVRNELLAALPAEQRHLALMVANAMAIAQRQLERGEHAQRGELATLGALLGVAAAPPAFDAQAELRPLHRLLAAAIRAGQADPGSAAHAPFATFLLDTCRRKVEESNPKYLRATP